MDPKYQDILEKSKKRHTTLLKDLRAIMKWKIKGFDLRVFEFHQEVFDEIDCTKCGNCCKVVSPQFNQTDINRISSDMGMRPVVFEKTYLKINDEEEKVPTCLPCPFLGEDLHCQVYKGRPRSCHDYPYTDLPRIQGRLGKLADSTLICPGAYLIAEKIVGEWEKKNAP